MTDLAAAGAAAVVAFAGTNADDLVVLSVLFMAARASGRPRAWEIWAGQYAGIGVLVTVAVVAALGLTVVPDRWVGLLGLIPLGLGVRGLWLARSGGDADDVDDDGAAGPIVAGGLVSVAGITLANGADNIAVYTPMFRAMDAADGAVTIAVFALLVAVWCAAGSWLGSHRHAIAVVRRWGHWLVPAVFVLIGAVIVVESGVAGELAGLVRE